MTIRLLAVDDHPVVQAGMVAMLSQESDFEVVGEAGTGAECLAAVPRLRPDLVLMDLRIPVLDGRGGPCPAARPPRAPEVLLLATYDTDADIVRAVEAGARATSSRTRPSTSWPTRSAGRRGGRRQSSPRSLPRARRAAARSGDAGPDRP